MAKMKTVYNALQLAAVSVSKACFGIHTCYYLTEADHS